MRSEKVVNHLWWRFTGGEPVLLQGPINRCVFLKTLERVGRATWSFSHGVEISQHEMELRRFTEKNSRKFICTGVTEAHHTYVDEWTEVPTCRARRGPLRIRSSNPIKLPKVTQLERLVRLIMVITSKCDGPTAYNYSHNNHNDRSYRYSLNKITIATKSSLAQCRSSARGCNVHMYSVCMYG